MRDTKALSRYELPASRAAKIAAEDNDGIVKISSEENDKVYVEFDSRIPLAADYLIRHQEFLIDPHGSRKEKLKLFK